jgi:hypothetical protein
MISCALPAPCTAAFPVPTMIDSDTGTGCDADHIQVFHAHTDGACDRRRLRPASSPGALPGLTIHQSLSVRVLQQILLFGRNVARQGPPRQAGQQAAVEGFAVSGNSLVNALAEGLPIWRPVCWTGGEQGANFQASSWSCNRFTSRGIRRQERCGTSVSPPGPAYGGRAPSTK